MYYEVMQVNLEDRMCIGEKLSVKYGCVWTMINLV